MQSIAAFLETAKVAGFWRKMLMSGEFKWYVK